VQISTIKDDIGPWNSDVERNDAKGTEIGAVSAFPFVVLCSVKELDYGALEHQPEKSRRILQLIP
jgi:hypothetical protein